jgi:hypothetical protein
VSWIQTYRGRAVSLRHPEPEDIDPTELAILLGRLHRFGGHTIEAYTVAEHSVRVASCLADLQCNDEMILAGLLHDAHEGYLGCDISSPLKFEASLTVGSSYGTIVLAWDTAIASRFGFDHLRFFAKDVQHADRVLLATEKRDLMHVEQRPWAALPDPLPSRITPMPEPAVEFARVLSGLTGDRVDLDEVRKATVPWRCRTTERRGLAGAVFGAPELARREQ